MSGRVSLFSASAVSRKSVCRKKKFAQVMQKVG